MSLSCSAEAESVCGVAGSPRVAKLWGLALE